MFGSRASIAHWLWNHNPFYVISALMMLFGVRQSYGRIEIGTIDCWMMMGILGTYTVVLAAVGVLIVRWGKVWDDSRSILLLLLLLFLAVSVSADDLFVKMESARGGAILLASGFSFSIAVLLSVLKGAGIRLKGVYLIPLILFLALFYIAPWWCSPELNPKNTMTLDWTLFLFPQVAALLTLSLVPAVRMQQSSVKDNGTPWPWPLFPWSAFGFMAVAVVLRSFAITMTYSPSGPMWKLPDDRSGIVLDSIWRPYFLVPFAISVMLLILEAGLVSGNRRLVRSVLKVAPGLLLLAWPFSPSEPMLQFLTSLTRTLGSPVWITVWLLVSFYGWAIIRRVENAEAGLFASALALSVIGRNTIDTASLIAINPLPLFSVGIILGILGLLRRSSPLVLAALCLVTSGLWVFLPNTQLAAIRLPICHHLVLAICLILSILWHDGISKGLQWVGAVLLLASAFFALHGPTARDITWESRSAYAIGLLGIGYLSARFSGSRMYWASFLGLIGLVGFAVGAEGYRSASSMFGRIAVAAFSWSFGTLVIAFLISAQKARWLPELDWYEWMGIPRPQFVGHTDTTAIVQAKLGPNPEPDE